MERLVVIGGDAAGMSAASQARRRRGSDDLDIVAFERGEYTSYAACGLPYYVSGDIVDADRLIARTPEAHRANAIDVRTRHEVVAIDLDRRIVRVRDVRSDIERAERFDQLVIATGAAPIRPDLPGIDLDGVHGVHTVPDALRIERDIVGAASSAAERPGSARRRRAVVVGGGYVGLEMAEALLTRGYEVTLVHRGHQPMPTLDDDMGARVATAMRELGITVVVDTEVVGFTAGADGRVGAVDTSNGVLPAEVVVLGIGVRPNSGLAATAGLEVGRSGGITVDDRLATSVPGVWAAGDCIETLHRVSGEAVAIGLGTHANKQGRVVGINVTGGHARFPGVIGTAITKVCDIEIARTGLSVSECERLGIDAVAATIEGTTRAGYYPGAAPIAVKTIAERSTGRTLGAQIVGGVGAGKRIDAAAVAIWNAMTIDALINVDLAYAPPFSPVWDPLLIAARKTADRL